MRPAGERLTPADGLLVPGEPADNQTPGTSVTHVCRLYRTGRTGRKAAKGKAGRKKGERRSYAYTPVRNTDWLAPGPLSETVRVACRMPLANGVRVTLIVELAPIATELPQLLLCANSVVCFVAERALLKLPDGKGRPEDPVGYDGRFASLGDN